VSARPLASPLARPAAALPISSAKTKKANKTFANKKMPPLAAFFADYRSLL
jgi:hypothetical protein